MATKKDWDAAVRAVVFLGENFQKEKKKYRLAVCAEAVRVCCFEKNGTERAIAEAERRTLKCFAEDTKLNHGTLKQWIMFYRAWEKLNSHSRQSVTWTELRATVSRCGREAKPSKVRDVLAAVKQKGTSAVEKEQKRSANVNRAIKDPMEIVDRLEQLTEALEHVRPNPTETRLLLGAFKQLRLKMDALEHRQNELLKAVQ